MNELGRIESGSLKGLLEALLLVSDDSVSAVDLARAGRERLTVTVTATRPDGESLAFPMLVRVDTPTEAAYLVSGGILPYVVEQLT